MNRTFHAKAAEEICRIGRSLFDRGYVHATAGNISVRLDEGILITSTDACLGHIQPSELAWVDAAGVQQGGLPASKSLRLHRRIYDADPLLARSSIRTARIWSRRPCAACGREADILPPITPYYVMKVGQVPLGCCSARGPASRRRCGCGCR